LGGTNLRVHGLLDVSSDLHVVSASRGTKILEASNFVGETDATGAVNAAGHGGLDQWSQILVLNSTLANNLGETTTVGTVADRLVLKITLASLVANGAVQRMVGQKELHDTLASLLDKLGIGLDLHSGHDRESAGGDGLGRLFNFNQAHSAVSGNGQTLVVTETGDVDTSLLTGLDDSRAGLDLDGLAINKDLDLVLCNSGGAELANSYCFSVFI
jgi:hypothetical protein